MIWYVFVVEAIIFAVLFSMILFGLGIVANLKMFRLEGTEMP